MVTGKRLQQSNSSPKVHNAVNFRSFRSRDCFKHYSQASFILTLKNWNPLCLTQKL